VPIIFKASNQLHPHRSDFLIIGAGIAAASTGYWLAKRGKVTLLEREMQPGYHSTGRSAALFMESYGSPQVRALTMASRTFFMQPPAGFSDHPLISARGALTVAELGQDQALSEHWDILRSVTKLARKLSASEVLELVPVFRSEKILGGVYEPEAYDMDVHAIHQGFLRGIKQHGGEIVCQAEVVKLERVGAEWLVHTATGKQFQAGVVLNAAGAWADKLGKLAGAMHLNLEPRRRSAMIFSPPPELDITKWPMAIGVNEDWYFKPDAGMLLGSPANADPVEPQDIQPEELDIALGIHRIQEITTLQIRRPTRTWAGLRSFVTDGDLVGGFDTQVPNFFWIAAQGGYGIQTSPAMGQACAALVCGQPLPEPLQAFGLAAKMLDPARLA
jgi:D-arginine dehydrogenase